MRPAPATAAAPATPPAPPVASRRPRSRIHHGDEFLDPYEWLRAKDDPEVIAYLEAENAYTSAVTSDLDPLVSRIFDEIRARTKETDASVPSFVRHGAKSFWYYLRTVAGSEYALYCRAPAMDRRQPPDPERPVDGEEVLLDCNAAAADGEFFALGAFTVSPDGDLLAYSVDTSGAERYTLRVKDLRSGELLADAIHDTAYSVAWAGGSHLFYTRADEAWRPYCVLRHQLGTPSESDVEVIREPDERFWLGVAASRDRRWVLISAGSRITSEVRLLSTADPEGVPRLVAPRREGVEYDVEPAGDRLLILHNDHAEDFELAEAPLDAESASEWSPVLPHQPGVRLIDVAAYAGFAVVSLRRAGLTGLHVLNRGVTGDFGAGADIAFDLPLYVAGAPAEPEYDTATIRIHLSSLLTPNSVYDYELRTGARRLLRRTPVLDDPVHGRYLPERYVEERAWATAPDGTPVPLSIVRRADVPLDGSAPALLYGYGSYESSMDPHFAISRLPLLDRGVVYAIAHVRGGGELGRRWYEDGKLLHKRHTFTDFISCADYLVHAGYTSYQRLAARGASAGGLLMGAVANLAPEKFRAIHAGVPFVDPLTSILDPELPLTVIEWDEWGDPLHDPEVYRYMRSYSPYENVRADHYPALLATTSLNDTRVLYVEPAKWVAALRHSARNDASRPILLKTEMSAGHGGVSGRYRGWRELAFEYAWLLREVGAA